MTDLMEITETLEDMRDHVEAALGERMSAAVIAHGELTITVDGAYWGAFGPSFRDGVGDTDLLLTRTIEPLDVPATALLRVAGGRPEGGDAHIGIR